MNVQGSIYWTDDDYYTYDLIIAYSSGVISAIIIPIQLLVLWTIFTHPDLRNNASYRILFRLIVLECLQSVALVFTSLFTIFPNLLKIIVLRKMCSVILSTFFLMGFVLMSELSIYRILVITKRCQPNRLPLPMLIIEILCYAVIIALSIPVYMNESMKFKDADWEYDKKDLYAKILDKAELFFCIPVLLLTYLTYLVLIAMIYGKRKMISETSNAKQEWLLFLQSTFITVYYVYLIADWHFLDYGDPEDSSLLLDIWVQIVWATAYYWTSVLLLIFNKTIRSKIFSFKTRKIATGPQSRIMIMRNVSILS